ncbi:hypothetical protein M405DRAFT_877462 [Rhizopogon salebrosus TDB-379]|nr:hypothetical protein M405DRAFT_877462 [Rhizopogon salebrosus TDB-379]
MGHWEPEDGPLGTRGWAIGNRRTGHWEPEDGGQRGTTDQSQGEPRIWAKKEGYHKGAPRTTKERPTCKKVQRNHEGCLTWKLIEVCEELEVEYFEREVFSND